MDKKIKDYIEKQEDFKKDILKRSRELILEIIPNCIEEFNWGVPVYDRGKYYIAAMKTRVHIGFAITGLSEKEIEEFEGTGKTMRHIKIHSLKELNKIKLTRLIKLVHRKASVPPDYTSV